MSTKNRQYRRRGDSDSSDKDSGNDSDTEEKQRLKAVLDDVRDLQKLRSKPPGLSAAELALGKELPREVQMFADPFKLKTGGVIDLKKIKTSDLKHADIEEGIRQQFSKESHLRDEDEEMRKYVEEELNRRRGYHEKLSDRPAGSGTPPTQTEDALFTQVADRLKKYQSKKNEEMLSEKMLCGIPEIDLGIDSKIKNIEETEAVKHRLLQEAIQKRKDLEKSTTFNQDLVKDLAKDYVQHGRFNISNTTDLGSEAKRARIDRPSTGPVPVVGEDTPQWVQDGRRIEKPKAKADPETSQSDAAMFQKFKRDYKKNNPR